MAPGFPFDSDQTNLRRGRSLLRLALEEEVLVFAGVEVRRQRVAALRHSTVGVPSAGDGDHLGRVATERAVRERDLDVVDPYRTGGSPM